jgi:predicted protein tyrosine phosphatase
VRSQVSRLTYSIGVWAADALFPPVDHTSLIVCPLNEVERAARRHAPSHVLTLTSSRGERPACRATPDARRLHLLMSDIASPTAGRILATETQVGQLLEFGRGWDAKAPMLIHCWAGISRSTAAAFIIATDRLGPGSERELAHALRRASPTATPNRRLIDLADAALGRSGAMVEAINEIGRGLEAPAGKLFELKVR